MMNTIEYRIDCQVSRSRYVGIHVLHVRQLTIINICGVLLAVASTFAFRKQTEQKIPNWFGRANQEMGPRENPEVS